MIKHDLRDEYCRSQAERCTEAARLSNIPEVREAYQNLALGWIQLSSQREDKSFNSTALVGKT
jgi:hypothetical protein